MTRALLLPALAALWLAERWLRARGRYSREAFYALDDARIAVRFLGRRIHAA